jgi:hypothetical protein
MCADGIATSLVVAKSMNSRSHLRVALSVLECCCCCCYCCCWHVTAAVLPAPCRRACELSSGPPGSPESSTCSSMAAAIIVSDTQNISELNLDQQFLATSTMQQSICTSQRLRSLCHIHTVSIHGRAKLNTLPWVRHLPTASAPS